MLFDSENPVCRHCIEGLDHEGRGATDAAQESYTQAWALAHNDFDRLTAAHYLARTQHSVAEKLHWDRLALDLALGIGDAPTRALLASLYLNVGKCYEDLGETEPAAKHYRLAAQYTACLPDDGYGNMIRRGVAAALERTAAG